MTTFLVNGSNQRLLQIDQDFLLTNNVLKIHTTLTNVTGLPLGAAQQTLTNVQFRRVTELTFNDSGKTNTVVNVPAPDPVVSVPGGAQVTSITPYSFGPGPNQFQSADPGIGPFANPGSGMFGPGDFGGGINLSLGTLVPELSTIPPGETDTISFNYYYAITQPGETEAQLERIERPWGGLPN